MMRAGEVLETVPGVIISQHSGEGKANQYYLRGFNLDHGTDFATTVAGMPVNMPTHCARPGLFRSELPDHRAGQRRAVLEGPVLRRPGRLRDGGSGHHQLHERLANPIVSVGGRRSRLRPRPGRGLSRVGGRPPAVRARGRPQRRPVDAPGRLPHGQRPRPLQPRRHRERSFADRHGISGAVEFDRPGPAARNRRRADPRFGALDTTDGGETYRYSGSLEWQRSRGNAATRVTAYGIGYDLNLFSNFTFFLDDPDRGDQFEQADRRFIAGAKISHRRVQRWRGRSVQNTVGVQLRNDDIASVGLYHTAGAAAPRDEAAGRRRGNQRGRVRAKRNRVDDVDADARRRPHGRLSVSSRCESIR